jgi:hypothetical protein
MAEIGDISGPLNLLFKTVRKSNDKEYSDRHVAKFVRDYTGGRTTGAHIGLIRKGAEPRISVVIALAAFFGVDVDFFKKAQEEALSAASDAAEHRDDQARVILMRMSALAPEQKQYLLDTINMLTRPPGDDRPSEDR